MSEHPADHLDPGKIHMLNQPLTTEEGFINPACLAELEAALAGIPETHQRLRGDPEWSTPWAMSLCEAVAAFTHAAVICARAKVPPDLAKVADYLRECLRRDLFASPAWDEDGITVADVSLCDLNEAMWRSLGEFSMFTQWNEQDVMGEYLIDLSACLHHACNVIRWDRRHDLALDRDFEARYGKIGEGER